MTRTDLLAGAVLTFLSFGRVANAAKPEKEGERPREIISDRGVPWSAGAGSKSSPIYFDPASADDASAATAASAASAASATKQSARVWADETVVAVFDVQSLTGRFADRTIDQLTDYLATRVTEELGYRVIPREQVRARLLEQKAASFKPCFHESCQIELGKALAAKKALSTKVLHLGKACALTATLYDLKTETAEAAASAKSSCAESDLMTAVDRLTSELKRASRRS
jgi:hypothetical protein